MSLLVVDVAVEGMSLLMVGVERIIVIDKEADRQDPRAKAPGLAQGAKAMILRQA